MFKHLKANLPIVKHELRDDDGNLLARGTLTWCQERLEDEVFVYRQMVGTGLPPGWTLLPYEIERWES